VFYSGWCAVKGKPAALVLRTLDSAPGRCREDSIERRKKTWSSRLESGEMLRFLQFYVIVNKIPDTLG